MTKADNKRNAEKTKQTPRDFSFFYDVAKLVNGNGFVQVIRALLSPVISRLFLPSHFGITQNFSSIANLLAVMASLRYEQTIMLPEDDEEAANLFGVSVFFTFVSVPITLLLVWFFGDDIARLLNAPKLEGLLWFIPLQVFAIAAFSILRQWNARRKKFARLSIAQVTNQGATDGLTTIFGLTSEGNSRQMVLARIIGQSLAAISLGLLVLKDDGKFIFDRIRWEKMKEGIGKYKKFPIFNIWASFLSTSALYLPGIILSAYFSPTIAGYFSYGQSVLRLPVALIATSIGQVFFQRGARALNKGTLRRTVEEAFQRLVVFGMFPMLVVMLIGEPLFATVFGAEWGEAGIYSQILSIWTLMIFILTPLGHITNILNRNEISLVMNLARMLTGAGSLIIGGIFENIYLGLWLFSISGVITSGWFIVWATKAAGIPLQRTFRYFINNLLLCAPFLTGIYLFQRFNPIPDLEITQLQLSMRSIGLIAFSGIVGIIYYLVAIMQDRTIREAIQKTIKKRTKAG